MKFRVSNQSNYASEFTANDSQEFAVNMHLAMLDTADNTYEKHQTIKRNALVKRFYDDPYGRLGGLSVQVCFNGSWYTHPEHDDDLWMRLSNVHEQVQGFTMLIRAIDADISDEMDTRRQLDTN